MQANRLVWVLSLLALSPAANAQTDGWQLLKSLAGEWDGVMEGHTGSARVTYEVVSNGSAVVERLKTEGDHADMITVYHRDGKGLMLTHYCAAGNQPRMRTDSAAAPDGRIEFRFLDVANLSSPEAGHMRTLTLTLHDNKTMTQQWSYREKGKDSSSVFRYKRK